ncbi:MAG TPA: hypothetical protein PKD51_16015 [Saprospiraceae bacterium]|nr:hypothetical protein [Saprospiraceae bacterium]HMU03526.1 hypothetical protein [Saprospiraceae bacterium]
MKIKLFFSLVGVLLFCFSALTQTDEQMLKAIKSDNFGYKFTHDIQKLVQNESVCFEYAMIGKDALARNCFRGFYNEDPLIMDQKYDFFPAQKVVAAFLEKENPKIVAINEAHHISKHRVVMQSFLPLLYKNGYRYLFVEGLNHGDKLLNERKFPKFMHSGLYIRDPEYANMIRKALELGFELIAYDQRGENRDEKAANHILGYMKDKGIEKIVIFAGYDHIKEKESYGKKSLIMHLNERLNTDAFTISQTEKLPKFHNAASITDAVFCPHSTKESKFYNGVNDDIDIAVFCSSDEDMVKSLLPEYAQWKADIGNEALIFPILIQAKVDGEGMLSIPMCVREVANIEELENTVLYLESGKKYTIEYLNPDYEIIYTKIIDL